MTRKQRIFAYVGAGLATGLLLAGALLYSISKTEYGMERVRRIAISWLTKRVDGTVHIGRLTGRGLLGGVTLHDFYIIDKLNRPFMRADSAVLAYNWRTLLGGEVVVERSTLYNPQVWFEQLPGDTIWNFQHLFPERGGPVTRRLILLRDMRIVNGSAVVRIPFETPKDLRNAELQREVIDTLPGGLAKVMRFDSVNGQLSRIIWESPTEPGRLIDIRSLSGRGFLWRDAMHVTSMRGTVTMRDSIVTFDVPDARFPASSAALVGRVIMERGLNFFDVRVDSRKFAFRDLQWLYPRLPNDGGGSGVLRIQSQRPKGILWLATDTRIAAPGTRLAGSFGVVTGADSVYFTNVNLRASPLNLALLQAVVPQKLPLKGLLIGTVEVKGGLSALETHGDVHLSNASGTSGVKWRGTVDVKHLGAKDLKADVDKFDLGLLNELRPNLNLRGQLTGHVEATGTVGSSIKFAGDVQHYLGGFTSSYNGTGTYTGGSTPGLDIQLNALPLSLAQIAASYPAFERLRGEARGPIRLFGPLNDLSMQADLQTAGGRAEIAARLADATERPRYAGTATLYSFRLDRLIDALPETTVDGKLTFDVAGRSLSDATGTLRADAPRGTIQNTDFRDAHTAMTLERGLVHVDTLVARTVLGQLAAGGTFGLDAQHSGVVGVTLRTDSIAPLDASENATPSAGRVRGTGTLTGSLESFDLRANVDVRGFLYSAVNSRHLVTDITATALATDHARLAVHTRADSLVAYGVRADSAILDVSNAAARGTAAIHAGSRDGHEYVADGSYENSANGLLFKLSELRVGNTERPWALQTPVQLAFDDHGLSVDSLDVRRQDGGRVHAGGRIAWHDASHAPEVNSHSDFRLDFAGVPFTEFALITAGASDVRGTLDGHVRVTGNAIAPVLDGDATVNAFGFGEAALDQLSGSFTYADRRLNTRIDAEKAGRRVFFADGVVPVNLAFVPVADRKLAEPLRFSMQADSLPATFLTAWVDGFRAVAGRVDGTLAASGTTAKPALSGALTLRDGDATWDVTNVRYRDVAGSIRLEGERVARVDATLRANGGSGHVTGTIGLKELTDPTFNLLLNAQNLLASKRRDVEFTGSGNVQLLGRFRQPRVTGVINVDQGAMFLDELYRRYQIVELDNPLLYDVVDTALVSVRTFMPEAVSPFIRNLIVDNLQVNVGKEAWLRSRDLNVEVSGNLSVDFSMSDSLLTSLRTAQDLVLNGTLRAVRGTYQFAGPGISRQFSIRDGTIEFPGTPGVDPNLAFNAIYRARSPQRDPIDILAVVSGTLRTPTVRLTSDQEPPISESDLASYLFFGVPTYELSATQTAAVRSVGLGTAASSTVSYLSGGLQAFAQNFGLLDYVSLSAADAGQGISTERGIGMLFARTQLELGRYIGQDIYVAVSQRFSGTTAGYQIPGVRVDWTMAPGVIGQFFVEDRYARSPDFGIQQSSGNLKKVFGFFVYREWGY